jgi:hypothetical protein
MASQQHIEQSQAFPQPARARLVRQKSVNFSDWAQVWGQIWGQMIAVHLKLATLCAIGFFVLIVQPVSHQNAVTPGQVLLPPSREHTFGHTAAIAEHATSAQPWRMGAHVIVLGGLSTNA